MGFDALFNNTTGISNTAVGANALLSNTTGIFNTANGGLPWRWAHSSEALSPHGSKYQELGRAAVLMRSRDKRVESLFDMM
jgi:hypothetical protein